MYRIAICYLFQKRGKKDGSRLLKDFDKNYFTLAFDTFEILTKCHLNNLPLTLVHTTLGSNDVELREANEEARL